MKERRVLRGIVLRTVDTKETDRILTLLTGELGKTAVVAKGARSRRSRYAAACQALCYGEYVVVESRGWQILSEATALELFEGLSRDVSRLSLGSYLAELTEAVTYEGMEAGDALSLLGNSLYALSALRKEEALVKAAFEWKLMALSGFAPMAEGCAVCGAPEPEEPVLDVLHGALRCASCRGTGLAMPLGRGGLQALRHVLYGNPKRIFSFTLPPGELRLFAHAAEAYTAAQLERGFRTLDFYKGLQGPALSPKNDCES